MPGNQARAERAVAVYPFLLGLFPLVHLYAANADRMPVRYTFVPAVLCLVAAFLLFGILRATMKDSAKAAVASTIAIILFYAYGRTRTLLQSKAHVLSDHRVLWPTFLLLALVGISVVFRSRHRFQKIVAPLNVFALAITAVTIFPAFRVALRPSVQNGVIPLTLPKQAPDVYYIILDAYGRKDVLQSEFGFDNSPFLARLEKQGFIVPRHSRSNYLYTTMSLSSSLNLDYFDALRPASETNTRDWLTNKTPLTDLIEQNRVARSFRAIGYKYVNLPSGLSYTNQSRIADVSFGSPFDLREFNSMLGQTTMLAPWFGDQLEQVTPSGLERLENYLLDSAEIPGPKFVFAHFLSPHPPYQFRADGSPAPAAPPGVLLEWGNRKGYVEQIRYLNEFVLRAVDRIIEKSKVPPIIIIQGDHGPALRNETTTQNGMEPWTNEGWNTRTANLSAYFVPPSLRSKVPDDITPVNAFRFVFREQFRADLPLLPNQHWSDDRKDIYRFYPIPTRALKD